MHQSEEKWKAVRKWESGDRSREAAGAGGKVWIRVGVSQIGEQGQESGSGSWECRAEMEKVKKVGHEMESIGNSAGWKGMMWARKASAREKVVWDKKHD